MILRLQRKLQIIRNRRSNMKMKQYVGMFFILSFCLFGEIREVTPLSELSSNILGEKVQKTSKIEKNIPKFSEEQKNTSTILQSLRSEEHTSELQSRQYLVCRLLLAKKTQTTPPIFYCLEA